MQKRFQISDGRVIEANGSGGPIIVFINPDDAEKKNLISTYSIDEHTLNCSLDADEPARMEFEPSHIALIYKRPKSYSSNDRLLFKISSGGVFLFKDQVILVLSEDIPVFEAKIFSKVSGMTQLVLKILYRSIFHFIEHLKVINAISGELETKINKSMENRYLISMFTLEKSLVYYLNAINSNGALIEKLKTNAAKIGFTQEELEFLDDIIIENHQCYKQAEIYSNILASLMDARASIVSNNLNVLMKTLNIITLGIMVPTLVVSIFSMNVTIPMARHPFAFWFIIALSAVAVLSFMLFWKYRVEKK